MTSTPVRLGLYGLALAGVFVSAIGLGKLTGASVEPAAAGGHESHPTTAGGHPTTDPAAAGLLAGAAGYRLVPQTSAVPADTPTEYRFHIAGPDGRPVTNFSTTHERDLHLIVVRRDLSGFQHLHPELDPAGTWSQSLTLPEAGQYRVFADFQPAALDHGLTLGVDLAVAGNYQPRPLPAPTPAVEVDGYRVEWTGDLLPGGSSRLTMRISRAGAPVGDLQPHLGAYGHLVVLREADLAYLHVHPDGAPDDGRTAAGPELTFHADVPDAGRYRLFLEFRHADSVRSVELTAAADGPDQTHDHG
ncbi:hypothetical protein [Micromonospora sp. LOL_023]|uniref:hypothetical protein n=1 Tax=Micromonospora sp. LOL_023 TaxID=3345418 RepID=UPI003A89B7E7